MQIMTDELEAEPLVEQDEAALEAELAEAKALQEQQDKERAQRLQALGTHVLKTYHERAGLRQTIEQRWLEDIRRYNGEYEPEILRALQGRKYGSRMYVPLTRRVVNIVEARLTDLLFPTEERNFSVSSSPSPQLVQAEGLAAQLPADMALPAGPNGEQVMASAVTLGIRELREEAQSKSDGMQREIDDQLRQANYGAAARRVIHEAMVIGTGVMQGPVVANRIKKVWSINGSTGSLQRIEDLSPTVEDVSAWDFYPDMSARTLRESESEIRQHMLHKAAVAKLALIPGFDVEAIRELLRTPAAHIRESMRDSLRMAAGTQGINDPRYRVLEFHGPVDEQELRDMGIEVPDDPLVTYDAVLWVAENGSILKAIIEPMDTGERPFSAFCWEKDPACIFGFGLSHEVKDMAEACNSAFRAAQDNLGLSVGPQIVVNSKLIRPHNGIWAMEPNKIWEMIKADGDARAAFAFFQIDSRLSELLGVFDRSKAMIDDIGGPAMAMQGQDAPSYLDTARGVGIAHNAANVWMRRAVRNWDDDVTSTLIPRFVDWNMQFSDKADIKGDFQVIARGVSSLLEGEGQQNKMALFLERSQEVPMPFKRKINQLKALGRSLRLDTVDLLPDDAEVKQMAEQIDNQPAAIPPEVQRVQLRQAELEDNKANREHEMATEHLRAQVRLAEIADRNQITIEVARQRYGLESLKTEAQLADRREQRAHDAQALNAELVTKARMGSGI